jgi:hypothetical protein
MTKTAGHGRAATIVTAAAAQLDPSWTVTLASSLAPTTLVGRQ